MTGPIASLIDILKNAQKNTAEKRRYYRGFTNFDIAEGLGKIALNDKNKTLVSS